MTDTAWKSGTRRGRPGWPIRISVWTLPGRWTTRTIRPDAAVVVSMGSAGVPAVGADQLPKQLGGHRRHVLAAEVAGHDERRASRIEDPLVGPPQRGRIESLHGLAGTGGRSVVGRRRSVDRADERLVGAATRVGLGLQEVVEPLVAQPLDLVLGERRAEHDLGEQLEGGTESGGGHVDPDARGVPAGLGMDGGPEPLGGLREGDRVVALRALGQGAGREHGRPGDLARFVGGTERDDDRRADQRPAGQVGDEDRQAVVERRAGDGRELVRAGRAGAGTLGDDDRSVERRILARHAATSSSSAVATGSASLASASAGGVAGR